MTLDTCICATAYEKLPFDQPIIYVISKFRFPSVVLHIGWLLILCYYTGEKLN